MSNSPNPNDPQPHDDALNALESFASGKPAPPPREDSVDASGFVGMLARGNTGEADPAGTGKPPPAMRRPMPQVSPKAVPQPAPTNNPLSGAIHVAKEIIPEQTAPPIEQQVERPAPVEEPFSEAQEEQAIVEETYAEPAPAAPARTAPAQTPDYRGQQRYRREVPQWYHTAVPISFTLGVILVVLGLWAFLAIMSSVTGSAMAPGFNPKEDGIVMPIVLVISLPVGIALEFMAVMMRKQLKRQAAQQGR
jgi:hypothetical protein